MAIAITIGSGVGVETYDGLVEFLTEHLELSSTTVARLPDLIRLAEYRLNRLLHSTERETTATVATVAGTQSVALPTDLVAVRQVRILGDYETGYPLDITSPNIVETMDYAGKPLACTVHGSSLLLGPIPDAAYTIEFRYRQKLDFIGAANQTNWLLTAHADAYVYMCSAVISLHHGDKEMSSLYVQLADEVIAEVNRLGNMKRGGPIRMCGLPGV